MKVLITSGSLQIDTHLVEIILGAITMLLMWISLFWLFRPTLAILHIVNATICDATTVDMGQYVIEITQESVLA